MAPVPALRSRLHPSPGRLAAALAVLAVLVCAVWVPLDILAGQNVLSSSGQDLVTSVFLAGLGFLIARRLPANPIGWLVLAGAVGLAITGAVQPYAWLAYRPGSQLPLGPVALLLGYSWLLPLGALATAILLFPDGHLPSPRWRWPLWTAAAAVICFLGARYAALLSAVIGHRVRLDGLGGITAVDYPSGRFAWLATADNVIVPVIAACLLSFVVAQVQNWRRSAGERRQQLKWLLAGTVAFLFGGIVVFPVTALDQSLPGPAGLPVTILNTLSFIALPACMAVAVLKYRLYDIDRILSRTLAYAIVTGLLVGVYAGVVLLSTQVLQFHSAVSVAVATLAAVALFSPLRRRVQNAVDRRFNRARYDADQAVAAFAARLKDAVDLDAVRADLLATATRTLEPAHASVWLRPAGQASTDGTSVSPGGTPVLHLKPRPMPLHMGYKVRK